MCNTAYPRTHVRVRTCARIDLRGPQALSFSRAYEVYHKHTYLYVYHRLPSSRMRKRIVPEVSKKTFAEYSISHASSSPSLMKQKSLSVVLP